MGLMVSLTHIYGFSTNLVEYWVGWKEPKDLALFLNIFKRFGTGY